MEVTIKQIPALLSRVILLLIMAYPDNVPEPVKSFFTFRPGQPEYRSGPKRRNHWGWLEVYPQHGYIKNKERRFEQVTVGVTQNATDKVWPAAMNDTDEVYGRGYTCKHGPNHSMDAIARGLNFQEQWDRALKLDPELIFVTGWNEWMLKCLKMKSLIFTSTETPLPAVVSIMFFRKSRLSFAVSLAACTS